MSPVTPRVKAFFDRWQQITNALGVEPSVAQYAANDGVQIVFHLEHPAPQQAMQERGLLPG